MMAKILTSTEVTYGLGLLWNTDAPEAEKRHNASVVKRSHEALRELLRQALPYVEFAVANSQQWGDPPDVVLAAIREAVGEK